MPTYEYECNACKKHFEKFQNMSDEPVTQCPECGGPVTRCIGTGGGMILKGGGFYRNDYRRQTEPRTRCGRDTTCCGRDVPCDSPPCSK